MPENWDFGSAVTVRLGIVAGAILGGLGGYWIGVANTPAGQGPPAWAIGAGGAAGLAVAWAVLTWLAQRHRGAGVITGGVLTVAALLALLARFAW
jgi:hypothetical protein